MERPNEFIEESDSEVVEYIEHLEACLEFVLMQAIVDENGDLLIGGQVTVDDIENSMINLQEVLE